MEEEIECITGYQRQHMEDGRMEIFFKARWINSNYESWENLDVLLEFKNGYRAMVVYIRYFCTDIDRNYLLRAIPFLRTMVKIEY